ncbi:MAG: sugar nucleotide-binding protein, partial [Pyramidobacter sp.]|nr:sugar nucleotide-binding protein [Pyramidobacter sp.]
SSYPVKAVRPLNSRLDMSSLDRAGFARLPHWEDALERYLAALAHASAETQ